nr:MAG TPA: hypothetical protein [Caudoviricetes sp.]
MFEIKLLKGGIEKEFSKAYVTVEDNLLAVEHQVRQTALTQNDKLFNNPKEHRKLNEAYLQMFVDMYGNQFTVDDLKQANIDVLKELEKLYLSALGINLDEEVKEEKKKQ